MKLNKMNTGKSSSVPAGLAAGAAVSMIVTGIMSGILAVLLNRESISWEMVGYGILMMIMLSSFLGAVTANAKIRRQKLLVSLMSGFLYWGILLSITALFFGGRYEAVGVTAFLIVGGCGCASMLGIGQGRHKYTGKRKSYYNVS